MKQKFNKLMRYFGYQNTRGHWLLDEIMGGLVVLVAVVTLVLAVAYYE